MKNMKTFYLLITCIILVACSGEKTLQEYYVENSESSDFVAIDISAGILNMDIGKLTPEQKKAVESLKKLNVLYFKGGEEKTEKQKTEVGTVKKILSNTKYQELMKIDKGSDMAGVYFVGKDDAIDEFIFFGSQNTTGFIIVRVLGKKMSPEHIMPLLEAMQNSNMDAGQLAPLQALMNPS
jgi:hypothetical protein